MTTPDPPGDDRLLDLVVLKAVYCDMGPHEGKYKVRVEGYVTAAQLDRLRERS